jgi:hypothetical protein
MTVFKKSEQANKSDQSQYQKRTVAGEKQSGTSWFTGDYQSGILLGTMQGPAQI